MNLRRLQEIDKDNLLWINSKYSYHVYLLQLRDSAYIILLKRPNNKTKNYAETFGM